MSLQIAKLQANQVSKPKFGSITLFYNGDEEALYYKDSMGDIFPFFSGGGVQGITSANLNDLDISDITNPILTININQVRTVFVDSQFGNDSTGEYQNFRKPYQTIDGAYNELKTQLQFSGESGTVYIRSGHHYSFTQTLGEGMESTFQFEAGCIAEEFGITDNGSLTPCIGKIVGYPQLIGAYFGRPVINLSSTSGSRFYMQCDILSKVGNFGTLFNIESDNIPCSLLVDCNEIYHVDTSGSFVTSMVIWGYGEIILNVKRKFTSNILGYLVRPRPYSPQGVVNYELNCPLVELGANTLLTVIQNGLAGSSIVFNTGLVKASYTPAPIWVTSYAGYFEFNGKIISTGGSSTLFNISGVAGSIFNIKGIFHAETIGTPISIGGTCVVNFEGSVEGTQCTDIINVTSATAIVSIFNSFIKNSGIGNPAIKLNVGCSVDIYNSIIEVEVTAPYSIYATSGVSTPRLHNVRSNKIVDAVTITDLLSPSGFIADANTITPKFY